MREIIVENNKAYIDNGIFFGQGVFETILYKEEPLFLKFHIERLENGMKIIGLKKLEEKKQLIKILMDKGFRNKVVKVTVTERNILINKRENPYKEDIYEKGFKLKTSKVLRNSTSVLTKIKSTNYIENLIEKRKAMDEGYDDALFLNELGNIAETTCSNIFFIRGEKIFTPKLDDGILNGTVRKWVCDNYEVEERSIKYKELEEFDEFFLTNSIMGIMKVSKLDQREFSSSISDKIRSMYGKVLESYEGSF